MLSKINEGDISGESSLKRESIYDFAPCMERVQQRIFFLTAFGVGLLQTPIMLYMMKGGQGYAYVFSWCLACNLFLFFWYMFAGLGKLPYITKTAVNEIAGVSLLCVSVPIYLCCKVMLHANPDGELFLTFANNNSSLVSFLEGSLYVSRTAVPQDWFKPKFILTYMLCLSTAVALLTYLIQLVLFSVRATQGMMASSAASRVPAYCGPVFYFLGMIFITYKLMYPDFNHLVRPGKTFISISERIFSYSIISGLSPCFLCFAGYFRYLYREKLRNEFLG